MNSEMKLGRWETRGGRVEEIVGHFPKSTMPWQSKAGVRYAPGGLYAITHHSNDLVRYLGPLELSPTPACADQAGAPVVSTVSTEAAGEQLKRMKQREAAIWRELEIYLPLVARLKTTASDLEEAIKRLEKEVEG